MTVVILDGTRTPFAKWKSNLASYSSKQLGAHALASLVEKYPEIKNADGVILAQVIQGGAGQNAARQVAIEAGISPSTPAITLNNVCLGGIASIADATRRILLKEGDLYIVGGMDSMTNAPFTLNIRAGHSFGNATLVDSLETDGLSCAISEQSMGAITDTYNKEYSINRQEQDEWAYLSHQRAKAAQNAGRLQSEITPIPDVLSEDNGIRPNTSIEKLASLRTAFHQDGTITAGNASQMTDGASIGIITTAEKAKQLNQQPLATVVDWAETAGPDFSLQTKPSDAIKKILDKQQLTIEDIDLFEINEAFASVVIASINDLQLDPEKVNVNGGAIALGHPLGGTGFRLVLTLAHELKRRGGGKGIATLCGGGGQGMAILIEVPKQ